MRDPWFERTVVLLCQYNDDGALGLVINRDGPVPIGAVVKGLNLSLPADQERRTWWGGPVGRSTGFVVWRGQADPAEGWTLGKDIAVSPSVERLSQLISAGATFHLCLGYAGWSPSQLDEEIARGAWLYSEPDASIVFEAPLSERYDRALALLGLTPEAVWMRPVDE